MAWFVAWILAALCSGPTPKDVTLIVWSDLHGDPSPKLFAWVDSLRRKAEAWKRPMLALDAGDALFGSDLSHSTRGMAQVQVLNLVKPDAIVLGNQDFIWTRARMDTLMGAIKVPVLTSNLRNAIDNAPFGRNDSKIWNFDSLFVGVVGVVDPDIAWSDRPTRTIDLRSEEPFDRVKEAVERMRAKGVKLAIALSHAGQQVDEDLAGKVPDLDLIVGSRDAKDDTLYKVGKVWIARLSSGGGQVRKLELNIEDTGISAEASTLPVPASIALPSAWKPVFDSIDRSQKARMDSTIGSLPEAWGKTKREGPLGNFLADAIRHQTGSDIGIWPSVGIHAGLPKGRVTRGDLLKVLGPFAQVSVFDLPGSELKRMIKVQFSHPTDFLFLSGVTCTPDSSAFGGPGTQVLVGGKPVQGGDHYKIAIPQSLRDDIFNLTSFSLESAAPEYQERWDRDMVLDYVKKNGLKTSLGRVPAMYGSSR